MIGSTSTYTQDNVRTSLVVGAGPEPPMTYMVLVWETAEAFPRKQNKKR